jgi:hypothetical protein
MFVTHLRVISLHETAIFCIKSLTHNHRSIWFNVSCGWETQGENFRSALCVERAHTVSQFMTSPGTKLKNNKSCPLTSSPDNNEQTRESANTHRTSLSLFHAAENTQTTTRPSTLVHGEQSRLSAQRVHFIFLNSTLHSHHNSLLHFSHLMH